MRLDGLDRLFGRFINSAKCPFMRPCELAAISYELTFLVTVKTD